MPSRVYAKSIKATAIRHSCSGVTCPVRPLEGNTRHSETCAIRPGNLGYPGISRVRVSGSCPLPWRKAQQRIKRALGFARHSVAWPRKTTERPDTAGGSGEKSHPACRPSHRESVRFLPSGTFLSQIRLHTIPSRLSPVNAPSHQPTHQSLVYSVHKVPFNAKGRHTLITM